MRMRKYLILFCCLPLSLSLSAESTNSVRASQYMVAAANPYASKAGLNVLAAGGTAIDAAVAVQLMLNLVEPESSGIGGGAFLLYWDASKKRLLTFDGREKAPASATPEYFLDADGNPMGWWDAVIGGKSVGVPGTLKLLDEVHARFGNQPWAGLMAPTIDLAEKGFPITGKLASQIVKAQQKKLDLFEPTRSYFFNADGSAKTEGQILKNPEFAKTLGIIARQRSKPFYQGEIAQQIVDAVKTEINPGQLTLSDLAEYAVIERQPVCFDYRGYEVCGMGPPTSGGLTMGQILMLLSRYDLTAMGPSAESWHLYAEAAKLAYADRGMYMADSDFVNMPQGLLDENYLASRAILIDPQRAMPQAEAGMPPWKEASLFAADTQLERPGTSHFVIVDQYRNMVSMTTTIETGFGSRVMTGGFLLNNELTDFSLAPENDGKPVANRVEGGKRPRSSMSPTIVLKDGEPMLLTGSPGGSRIINYVTQSVIAILDWGMEPQQALNMGHVVNRNGATELEAGTEAVELAEALQAKGHEVKISDLNSGLHAILLKGDQLIGGADPRRDGVVMGK